MEVGKVNTNKFAGVRSSNYGIKPFPSAQGWTNAMKTMAGYFPGSQATGVWLVGEVDFDTTGMDLEFPSDGNHYPKITFADKDKHESFLTHFDSVGIKVFLQVEPGFADMITLIDLVLSRYKHHPCVIGFGVDVEWYKNAQDGGTNAKVSDKLAQQWEKRVKSHNNSYRLFLKHFDKSNLCPSYRGDIIFIDDSEDNGNFNEFMDGMLDFAETFYPNTVMYQIGYPSDKKWWNKFNNPPEYIGKALGEKTRQSCGIIWVDFSLRDVLPTT